MRRPLLLRLSLVIVGAVLLASCTVSVPGQSTGAAGRDSTGRPAARSQLDWRTCHGSYQCATLEVPLDWFHRSAATIDLALIRKPAEDPHPLGSLLLNPGGPGQPGVGFLTDFLASGSFPTELSRRFDLVSWDPRGTGASAPVACLTEKEFTEPEPLPYPPTAAGRARVIAKDRAQQDRCLKEDGRIIPYVGTKETVRDLDAIRSALGDAQLTYVGFSYGTAIGLEYQATFPDHVRAMVLDGIDPPGRDPIAATEAQVASFETDLNAFLTSCKSDASCTFGDGHPKEALERFLALLSTGARIPASYTLPDDQGKTHERDGTLGYSEAIGGIVAALYSEDSWGLLRQGLADASRLHDPDGHILLSLRDFLAGRGLDGTWDHSTEANAAIGCADQKVRATSDFGDLDLYRDWQKRFPFLGSFAIGLPGCHGWPAARHPLRPLTKTDLAKAKPFVLVNSNRDPATPYADALKTLTLLPGSRLVTWVGADHTSFGSGHDCIDDAVVPYLVNGTLPAEGTVCGGEPD